MPSVPQTNPSETVFDLDHGQQIVVEMDTIFKRIRFDDPNPATSLLLEHCGRCWSFTLEDGVWWHSEFTGDVQRVPQLQIKRRATEKEKDEREKARKEWEQRNQSTQGPTTGDGAGFPGASNPTDAQIRFPVMENGFQWNTWVGGSPPHPVPYFPSANMAVDALSFCPPVFPSQQNPGWFIPPPPFFPQGFPFAPSTWLEPPAFVPPMVPSHIPASQPSYRAEPPTQSTQRAHQINEGTYVHTGGRTASMSVNRSMNIIGSDNDVSWTPDHRQELNGHYQVNWP